MLIHFLFSRRDLYNPIIIIYISNLYTLIISNYMPKYLFICCAFASVITMRIIQFNISIYGNGKLGWLGREDDDGMMYKRAQNQGYATLSRAQLVHSQTQQHNQQQPQQQHGRVSTSLMSGKDGSVLQLGENPHNRNLGRREVKSMEISSLNVQKSFASQSLLDQHFLPSEVPTSTDGDFYLTPNPPFPQSPSPSPYDYAYQTQSSGALSGDPSFYPQPAYTNLQTAAGLDGAKLPERKTQSLYGAPSPNTAYSTNNSAHFGTIRAPSASQPPRV